MTKGFFSISRDILSLISSFFIPAFLIWGPEVPNLGPNAPAHFILSSDFPAIFLIFCQRRNDGLSPCHINILDDGGIKHNPDMVLTDLGKSADVIPAQRRTQ